MPSLNWIGREAVLNHHNEIPYRLPQVKHWVRNLSSLANTSDKNVRA